MGYAAKMFGTLADHGINIDTITTSDIRITCIIDEHAVPEAVRRCMPLSNWTRATDPRLRSR